MELGIVCDGVLSRGCEGSLTVEVVSEEENPSSRRLVAQHAVRMEEKEPQLWQMVGLYAVRAEEKEC